MLPQHAQPYSEVYRQSQFIKRTEDPIPGQTLVIKGGDNTHGLGRSHFFIVVELRSLILAGCLLGLLSDPSAHPF